MENNSRFSRMQASDFHSEKNSSLYGRAVKKQRKKAAKSPPGWAVAFQYRLKEWGWSVPRLAKEMGRADDAAFVDRLYKIVQGRVEHPRGRLLADIAEALKIREVAREYRYDRSGETIREKIDLSSEDIVADDQPDLRSEDVAAALPAPPRPRTVKLKGYVGAGSEMHYYRLADEEYEEVPAPPNATPQTVAVEIRGTSMGAQFPGWLVFYRDVHSPVSEALHGRLCVVGLADDRILIKRIQPQKNGLYSLLSNADESPIHDAVIEWAAPVTALMPRS